MKKILFVLLLPAFLLANTGLAAAAQSCEYEDSNGDTRYASDGTTMKDDDDGQYYTCRDGDWQ
jgi:hypothetical protein